MAFGGLGLMGVTLKLGGDMIEKLRMETKETRQAIEKSIENSRLEIRECFAKMETDRTYSVHERISSLEERSKKKSFGASAS
jgi:hypothetical protein